MHVHRSLVALAVVGACTWPVAVTAQQQEQGAAVETTVRDLMTSQDIQDAIEDELFADPGVDSHRIDVDVIDGVVTLTGTVDDALSRDRATLVSETVKGVESVVNQVVVDPFVNRSPAELRSDIEMALLTNAATESYEVEVSADDSGAVSLEGQVDSWAERRLAERVAKGVAGVTGVDNNLTVIPDPMRVDSEIQQEIEEALHWSRLIDDGLVDVSVEDGAVSLTGTVGSAAEKRQAELRAWTTGVTSVDVTGLEVAGWARNEELRPSPDVGRADADIREAVEKALLYDPRVNSLDVDTTVDGSVVTLRGSVRGLGARRAAVDDARNTVGVTVVRDRLRVEPITIQSDVDVARVVTNALTRAPAIDRSDVTVSVLGGTAYLYGTVDNYFEKALADDLAAEVTGVTRVENELDVRSEDWVGYDPFLYDPYLYGFTWYDYTPAQTWIRDERIADQIESEFWWSPFVDSDDISVQVKDGVATLTGTVDSWSEYRDARENAYEGGAVWVDNELTVDP